MDYFNFCSPALDQQVAQNITLSDRKPRQASITQNQRPRNSSVSTIASTSSYYSCSSSRSSSPSRAPLSEKDAFIAGFAYLPGDENTTIHCAQPGCGKRIENGAMNHPAVILKMWTPKGGDTVALACTISGCVNPCPQDKARNLPIGHTTTSYSPSYKPEEVMCLERTGTLSKQSYIQVKHVYEIPLSKIAGFSKQRYENRLSQESYSYLMSVLGLEKAQWIPTTDLESGFQAVLPVPRTSDDAEFPKLTTTQKIITPMAALLSKTEKALSSLSISSNITAIVQVPSTQVEKKKGKKNKLVATSVDLLSNMRCNFQ